MVGVISILLRHFCLRDLFLSEIFQCSFDLWDIAHRSVSHRHKTHSFISRWQKCHRQRCRRSIKLSSIYRTAWTTILADNTMPEKEYSMQAGKEVPWRNSRRQAGKQMNENQPKERWYKDACSRLAGLETLDGQEKGQAVHGTFGLASKDRQRNIQVGVWKGQAGKHIRSKMWEKEQGRSGWRAVEQSWQRDRGGTLAGRQSMTSKKRGLRNHD